MSIFKNNVSSFYLLYGIVAVIIVFLYNFLVKLPKIKCFFIKLTKLNLRKIVV